MAHSFSRPFPGTVGVALAVGIVALLRVSSAVGEPADAFDPVPSETAVEERNVAESSPPGPASQSAPLSVEVAGQAVAPEATRLAATDTGAGPTERMDISLEVDEERFVEEYDPWEPFNERMFSFNLKLDRFAVKPAAKAWDKVLPDRVEQSLKNAFKNLSMPRRLVNNLLQLKLGGAGRELSRFLLNTTVGIGGFFDVAKRLGIEESNEDTGQTLAVYGAAPGPYLILPFLPPLTVRDGIGFIADAALDPFNYVIFPVAALVSIGAGDRVNDRALDLELFETVEEATLDLYSGVRNAYLQRRQKAIEE